MPGHWEEWERAKKEIKEDTAARGSAVDQALGILRGAQQVSKENPDTLRCSVCGGVKFKTREKGRIFVCRSCGKVMQKDGAAP